MNIQPQQNNNNNNTRLTANLNDHPGKTGSAAVWATRLGDTGELVRRHIGRQMKVQESILLVLWVNQKCQPSTSYSQFQPVDGILTNYVVTIRYCYPRCSA